MKLGNRLNPQPSKRQSDGPPSIIKLMKKAIQYSIDHAMMDRLNYVDLLALIVEMDIDTVTEALNQKEQRQRAQKGYEVRNASNQDIINMHRR